MKEVFKDIQQRIQTIPEFQYIGEDWGQLNLEQPPVNWPCALIDLGDADFSSTGMKTQRADATVNITIADIRYHGLSPVLPQEQEEKAFEIFDLIAKVNKLLHGTGGKHHSALCRVSLEKKLREDAVREFVVKYKFSYMDNTATRTYHKTQAEPQIQINR